MDVGQAGLQIPWPHECESHGGDARGVVEDVLQKDVRCVLVLRDNVNLIVTYLPVILVIQQIGLLRNKQQLLMMQKPISETVVQPPQ